MNDKPKSGVDIADLYDHEMAAIDRVGRELSRKYSHMSSTRHNYEEFAKDAQEAFFKIGFVVSVDYGAAMIMGSEPEISIMGKVPGHEDHSQGFDHERKRHEVLKSKETGEKYTGQRRAWN